MNNGYFRQQGDVIIERIDADAFPTDGKPVVPKARGYVLAEGEHTGHAHRLEDVQGITMVEKDGMFFLKVEKETKLRHEEHEAHVIVPGLYRVRGVKEYDHFSEEARKVRD